MGVFFSKDSKFPKIGKWYGNRVLHFMAWMVQLRSVFAFPAPLLVVPKTTLIPMKKTVCSPPCLAAFQRRRWLFAAVLLGGLMFAGSQAQEVLLKEDFNTDGAGTRYTVEGGGKSEQADHANNGIAADQTGPVYWARSSEVSIVGVPGPTPARRIIMAWDSAIPADQISPDFFKLFDSVVKWATKDKAKLTVMLSPAGVAPSLAAHLEAAGHTIVDDDASIPAEKVAADPPIRAAWRMLPFR
jgi:hypothetical protein